MRRLVAAGACAFALLGASPPPTPGPAPRADVGSRYYTVATPQAHWNAGSGDFTAAGRVKLTEPGLIAYADHAIGNTKNGTATLTGNVEVHDSGAAAGSVSRGAREPGTLTCDQLDVNGKIDAYRATGHAHYTSADRSATADTMILDRKHHKLYLTGAVALEQHGTTLAGDRVDVNLRTGATDETGAPLIITSPFSPRPSVAPTQSPSPAPSARP